MVLAPLVDRWYAFVPLVLCLGVAAWRHGAARAAALGALGWLVAFAAEWGSTRGPGIPFGPYVYRAAALAHDWRVAGVPVFDSVSFTWLALAAWWAAGALGGRGWRRALGATLAVVAVDVVVDPVALRGAHWWLGRIYRYPAGGPFFGVTLANYAGWLLVAAVLVGLCAALLREPAATPAAGSQPPAARLAGALGMVLIGAAVVQATVLAALLGVGPAAAPAVGLLALAAVVARGAARRPAPSPTTRPAGAPEGGPPRVVVACALGWEARVVRRAVPGWRRAAAPPGVLRAWRRGSLALWLTGLGPPRLPAGALPPELDTVVVTGVAGATGPGWAAGDLAVGVALVDGDGGRQALAAGGPDGRLVAAGARPATLAAAAAAVDQPAERARWAERGADLVELETPGWARLLAGLPDRIAPRLLVLRAVLDTPARPLGRAATLVGPGRAGIDRGRLLAWLVRDPGAWLHLVQVAWDRRRAAASLEGALAGLLAGAGGWAAPPASHQPLAVPTGSMASGPMASGTARPPAAGSS